jgi:ribosome-binding protein aMBF1 (putative translation factor)
MIRNEREYREAVERITSENSRFKTYQAQLEKEGLGPEEIRRALDPLLAFHRQIEEEIAYYERLRRGEFDEIQDLDGLGNLLISLRIAVGISQAELARRLSVSESQVSRDERNEYHGITVERARRVLDALGVTLHCRPEIEPKREKQQEPVPA